MNEDKKAAVAAALAGSTMSDITGKSRYSPTRLLFSEIIDDVVALKKKFPKAGAARIATRLTAVMQEAGFSKFKLNPNSLVKWYHLETGEHFASKEDRARGIAMKAKQVREGTVPSSRPIIPEEPEPEEPVVVNSAPIGLDEVAGMSNEDLAILGVGDTEDDDLASPPDPFGDV